jgi:hypothetical protein
VTVDAQGAERRVGRAPVLDGAPPGPPEETPEARAALRKLAKDLRERGWRPLRARGVDFGERQWYARRFRWPTEAEMQPGVADGDAPDRERAGHPGGAPRAIGLGPVRRPSALRRLPASRPAPARSCMTGEPTPARRRRRVART